MADVLLLHGLFSLRMRAFILPICGAITHMILVTNLSYGSIPVKQGWWMALIISILPLVVMRSKSFVAWGTIKRMWFPSLLIILAVAFQTWPLIKIGVMTTIPAENSDWLTYVSHTDILSDYSQTWKPSGKEYAEHFVHVDQYVSGHFRFGASHLMASSTVLSGHRGILIFNAFCGCLVGLGACAMAALANSLRLRRYIPPIVGLVSAVHPSLHWTAFAAFMPQLVGIAITLCVLSSAPLLYAKGKSIRRAALFGFLVCGLMLGYNEIAPIAIASVGLSVMFAVRLSLTRWKNVGLTVVYGAIAALLFSPIGIINGIQGMLTQITLSKSTGGSEQPIREIVVFLGSALGYLPISSSIAQVKLTWYPLVAPALCVTLIIVLIGFVSAFRGRRSVLAMWVIVSLGLLGYILTTYENVILRTWAVFKLAQYNLPIIICLIALASSVFSRRLLKIVPVISIALCIGMAVQGGKYLSRFPLTPVDQNLPRYVQAPTTGDLEFIAAVERLIPREERIYSLNRTIPQSFSPSVSLLLYPRVLVINETTSISTALERNLKFAVEDTILPLASGRAGVPIWNNERFVIYKLPLDEAYVALAVPAKKLLTPESAILIPSCVPHTTVALHGYAPRAGILHVSDARPGNPQSSIPLDGGEFIELIPIPCEKPSVAKIKLKTSERLFLLDHQMITDQARETVLRKASIILRKQGQVSGNLLPILGDQSKWQTAIYDGSPRPPAMAFTQGKVTLSSVTEPLSGALFCPLYLTTGQYELEAEIDVTSDIVGTGKGIGIGLRNGTEPITYIRSTGISTITKRIQIEKPGHYPFVIGFGGFGRVTGAATINNLRFHKLAKMAITAKPRPVSIPDFVSPLWKPVAYDGTKVVPEVVQGEKGIRILSTQPTSAGLGTVLMLERGLYSLDAELAGTIPAVGSGKGYVVAMAGLPDSVLNAFGAGSTLGERVFSIEKPGPFQLVVLVGGYGLSQGGVTLKKIGLSKISDEPSPVNTTVVGNNGSILPELGLAAWQSIILDASSTPGKAEIKKQGVRISGPGPHSTAAVTTIRLSPGYYFIQGNVFGDIPATGTGAGYGMGFLGMNNLQWYTKEKGGWHVEEIFEIEQPTTQAFGLIVGGFGTVNGGASFSDVEIHRLRYEALKSIH